MILIINRYLASQIFIGLCLAAAVLLPLFSFLDLLEQLESVGKGTYQTRDAFLYTALLLPRRFIQLTPFIALLGNVIALGRMAINLELTALRVAGVSPARISLAPLWVGVVLLLFVAILEEFVAPQFQQDAILQRAVALDKSVQLGKNLGIWTRDEHYILRIGEMVHAQKAEDIELLNFDDNGFLLTYIHAKYADILSDNLWELRGVTTKTFTGDQIDSVSADSMSWKSFLNPKNVATLTKPPESLAPSELFQHVSFLNATGQETDAHALTLWRKIGGALTTIAMLLLPIPIVLRFTRTGFGSKLVSAALIGIGIYLLDQIIANVGLLWHLNPLLIGIFPGLTLIVLSSFWLLRTP